jgi:hypothetical protein
MTLVLCIAVVLLVALCFAALVLAFFLDNDDPQDWQDYMDEVDTTDYSESEEDYYR